MNQTRNCTLYCVIGDPIEQSLSPAIHNAAFKTYRIDAVYLPVFVRPDDLANALFNLRALDAKGINVTSPHKTEVIKYLDTVDKTANEIGAVNTIVNKKGKLVGYNTDALGAVEAIKRRVKNLSGKTAIILGTGGSAKAVSYGLKKEGTAVILLDRKRIKKKLSLLLPDADILCNCTPVGMCDNKGLVPKKLLQKKLIVFDVVYKAGDTRLIKDAKTVGAITIGGEEMLVSQGAAAFELWTGIRPDARAMLKIVKKELQSKETGKSRRKNICLIGFMGSGKTSVGRALAEKLKMKFIDIDSLVERKMGKSAGEIFSEFGEKTFRELESDQIAKACQKNNCVLSSGGGAILDYSNILKLKHFGRIVLLKATPKTIIKRLENEKTRPLLLGRSNSEKLTKTKLLLTLRRPYYELARDVEIETDDKSIAQVAQEIVKILGEQNE